MANLKVLDGDGLDKYLKATGTGADGSPHVPEHLESNSAAIAASLATLDNAVAGNELQVDVVTMPAVTGTVGISGTVTVDGSGVTQPVSAASLPLPTGAATAANQASIIALVDGVETLLTTVDTDTGNIATSVASVDTKTPALGQALAAASVPMVLPEAQVTALTPPAAITGFATSAKQDTLLAATGALETLLTTIDEDTAALAAAVAGTEMQVDIVTSALPTGAATEAKQDTVIGHLDGVETVLGTIDTDTGTIATAAATIAGAVSGTEMQVDVLTLPTVTVQRTPITYSHVATTFATSGDNTIIAAPGSGQRLVVSDLIVQNESAVTTVSLVKAGATTHWRNRAAENGGLALSFGMDEEWRLGDNEALVINLSGANTHGVSVRYYSEAV